MQRWIRLFSFTIIGLSLLFSPVARNAVEHGGESTEPIQATAQVMERSYVKEAAALEALGLWKGTGGGWDLKSVPSRMEGAVMIVRLMGKEAEALKKRYEHPFADVPQWGEPYAGYLYHEKIVAGQSETKFGSSEDLSAAEYILMVLRIAGYTEVDEGLRDEEIYALAEDSGFLNAAEIERLRGRPMLRKDVVHLSFRALNLEVRASGQTLLQHLMEAGAVEKKRAMEQALIPIKHRLSSRTFSFDLNEDQREDYYLALNGWMARVEPEISVRTYPHATYYTYRFQGEKDRLFALTFVELFNGDVLYFAENRVSSPEGSATLHIRANEKKRFDVAEVREGELYREQSEEVREFPAYVSGGRLHYRIGNVRSFEPLGHTVLDEKTDAALPVRSTRSPNQEAVFYTLSLYGEEQRMSGTRGYETWGILSAQPIVPWENEHAVRFVKMLEEQQYRVLRSEGLYTVVPHYGSGYDYQPGTARSFYQNPSNVNVLPYVHMLQYSDVRVIHDVLTHMAYRSVQNQNAEGFWYTYPMSKWLHDEYHIGYRYMDNRKNIDNVLFLSKYIRFRPDETIEKAVRRWDQYHRRYILQNGVKTGENGILLPDYVGDERSKTSHISLNHHAANMNYLFERYSATRNPQYKSLAEKLLQGIEDTCSLWVKENSDLHYALTPDLTPYTAEDYDTLTLEDLMTAQYHIRKIYGEPNRCIAHLIEEKKQFVEKKFSHHATE